MRQFHGKCFNLDRDLDSSGKRELVGGLKKNKYEALLLSKVFNIFFLPVFIRLVVDVWWKNQQADLPPKKKPSKLATTSKEKGWDRQELAD